MENKLDILTKKLYEEGVDKAKHEADEIISKAKQEAAQLIADAETKIAQVQAAESKEIEDLRKKAESEMALSARQAIASLKQSITGLIAGEVAGQIAKNGFEDKNFVQELLISIVKKWDVASGSLNLELILSPQEKEQFETFIAKKYKELLDKGLKIKIGDLKDQFIIQPGDGGYQVTFSEALFEAFFEQYMRGFTKTLLYK